MTIGALQRSDGELRFTVHDTGAGFDTAVVRPARA